uniref:Ubiquitin fusion degradation protein UFD1 n=1 Tax=Spongospora subterranea TaxID=70186 RepID=A0A0H5R9K1_9EUKA|eukprot:CRZ10357.1 hypothetical protein [Spongospora subterranea]
MAGFEVTMPAYSALFLASGKDVEEGDKIVLPDTVLRSLLLRFGNNPMPSPVIFKISNVVFGRVSHCGVLEFTAQDDAAFLPNWMMENLLLSDGAEVKLSLIGLPKLTFVRLQPTQFAFTKIPNPKAALEEALHKFTALTRGDTIMVKYHHDDYLLHVTAVQPDNASLEPPAGCVIDTTLEVDFDSPLEEAPKEEPIAVIEVDHSEQGHVMADQYKFFRVKIRDPTLGFKIVIETRTPDARPDIYVSTKVDRPSAISGTFSGNIDNPVVVYPDTPGFSSSWYYIAVHSYGVAAAFSLTTSQVEPPADSVSVGKQLGSSSVVSEIQDPNSIRCDNCMRPIPKAAFDRHSIVCARNNWACPICHKVMSVRDKANHNHCDQCDRIFANGEREKHNALFHVEVVCKCGQKFDSATLPDHQANNCQFRLKPCKWCCDSFPFNQVWDHEQMCGSKTVPCLLCSRNISRRMMDVHKATEHGINPCIDATGNRNTAESVAQQERNLRAQQLVHSYGVDSNDDSMLARAIAASLEERLPSTANDNEDVFLRAIGEEAPQAPLRPTVANHDSDLEMAIAESMNGNVDHELQRAIAASMDVDDETQRDIERAIAASLAEHH